MSVPEETLATFFSMCGTVTAVRGAPPAPGAAERRAWVEFEDAGSARIAHQYDGTVMGGATLRVTQSRTAIHTNALAGPVPGSHPAAAAAMAQAAGGMPAALTHAASVAAAAASAAAPAPAVTAAADGEAAPPPADAPAAEASPDGDEAMAEGNGNGIGAEAGEPAPPAGEGVDGE